MPIGNPDYGRVTSTEFITAIQDLGELAARLESPVTFLRGGNVQKILRCDDTLTPWDTDLQGAGSGVALASNKSYRYNQSIEITAGSDGSRYAAIANYLPYTITGSIGIEIAFSVSTNIEYIDFQVGGYVGSSRFLGRIRLDLTANELQVFNSASAYEKVDDIFDIDAIQSPWHIMKLVIDFENNIFRKFYLDSNNWDLSGYSLNTPVALGMDLIQFVIFNYGSAGNNPVLNVNDFIYTINEP